MQYQVQVQQVASQLTAVVRGRAQSKDFPTLIPQGCGEVWNYMRSAQLPRPGRNMALYLDCGINYECGVEVFQPFVGNDRVVCSSTPAGTVVTTAHWGPYQRLGDAHQAIGNWFAARGLSTAVVNWEIYGHWTDDPSQLRTDIFYLLPCGAGDPTLVAGP
jgi:effector-binding domain-containing protein